MALSLGNVRSGRLQQMIDSGEVQPPFELGMPDLMMELAPGIDSLSEVLVAERNEDCGR